MFSSTGTLSYGYDNNKLLKLIVNIDSEISRYYCSFIPKYYTINRQMYPPHITVVRKEKPPNLKVWNKYEGQEIEFFYSNQVFHEGVYFWLNAFSTKLEEIRLELGLPISSKYTRPPDSFERVFHITLANCKQK